MKPDITHEVNLYGNWFPALVVDAHDDGNGTFLVLRDGQWEFHDCQRGHDQGNFRDK